MKRFFASIVAAVILAGAPALAQTGPGGVPVGAGLQRGMEQLNESGEVGFVTLFDQNGSTRIVTAMNGVPPGRTQTVAIQRGKDCSSFDPGMTARSADLVGGTSRGTVAMSQDRLTSGNYDVVVYSTTGPGARPVACGHLYR
jgi:hypothetical protein